MHQISSGFIHCSRGNISSKDFMDGIIKITELYVVYSYVLKPTNNNENKTNKVRIDQELPRGLVLTRGKFLPKLITTDNL